MLYTSKVCLGKHPLLRGIIFLTNSSPSRQETIWQLAMPTAWPVIASPQFLSLAFIGQDRTGRRKLQVLEITPREETQSLAEVVLNLQQSFGQLTHSLMVTVPVRTHPVKRRLFWSMRPKAKGGSPKGKPGLLYKGIVGGPPLEQPVH